MPSTGVERQVAFKVWLASLHGAEYVKQEGWAPNYVTIGGKQISRVHVVATVVSKFMADDGNYGALTLDDGSDTIRIKAFGPDVKRVEAAQVGKLVRFVGKVKEYNDEVYLSPEIIRAIDNPNWLVAHRLELGDMPPRAEGTRSGTAKFSAQQQSLGATPISTPQTEVKPAEVIIKASDIAPAATPEASATDSKPEGESINAKILALIGELDAGDGAPSLKIIESLGMGPEVAKPKIAELLASGEIYEPKKGFLKLL